MGGGVLTGLVADHYTALALLGAFASVGWFVVHRSPILGLGLFLTTVAFVPYWLGPTILSAYFPPACAVGIFVLMAWQPAGGSSLTLADAGVLVLFALCLAPLAVGAGSRATAFVVLAHWVVGYGVGRLAPTLIGVDRLYRMIAVLFTLVAVGLLAEFLLHWNPFVEISRNNVLYQGWGTLQERGGVTRAEGAFGHSIAAGACLALALPLTIASSFRVAVRAAMAAVMLAATVVTFSRIGILTALLGLVLSVCLLPGLPRRLRAGTLITFSLVALASYSRIATVFADAGTEASNSAGYRLDLTALLPVLSPLGLSPSANRDGAGGLRFGSFRSIDSALLLVGLTYGVIAMVTALLLLSAAWFTVLRGVAAPATIALAAQVPAILTVALITQYAIFLWFVVGLAAAGQSLRAEPTRADEYGGATSGTGSVSPAVVTPVSAGRSI